MNKILGQDKLGSNIYENSEVIIPVENAPLHIAKCFGNNLGDIMCEWGNTKFYCFDGGYSVFPPNELVVFSIENMYKLIKFYDSNKVETNDNEPEQEFCYYESVPEDKQSNYMPEIYCANCGYVVIATMKSYLDKCKGCGRTVVSKEEYEKLES